MDEPSFNACLEKCNLMTNRFVESFPLKYDFYAGPFDKPNGLKYLIRKPGGCD
jgi:hypothetical protein